MESLAPRFAADAWRRLKALPWLKSWGITGFMALFFMGYFATLKHPLWPVRLMPPTVADGWIKYEPWTVSIYCSLWFYVLVPPALMDQPRRLWQFGAVAGVLAVVGLGIFLLWPTRVEMQGTGFLKTVDLGGNACPSLHAAFAVFTAVCLHKMLPWLAAPTWLRASNWGWCAAILYSTISTKQHVIPDLIAGSALGWLTGLFCPPL